MPSGKVKWYDAEKGFGFLTRDDGGEVFVHSSVLPKGVTALKPGQKVEFGIAESRRGQQALSVRIIEPPTLARGARGRLKRKKPDEMAVIVEDLIKLLDELQTFYQKGRQPDAALAKKAAVVLRAVADDLDG